ncbi:hypothetical protein E9K_08804, partial [Moraxella catarrhalis 103P14B1]
MTSIRHIQTQIGTTVDGVWGDKSKQALKSAINDGKIVTITKNISLNELLASNTAKKHNIDNMPNQAI